MWSDITQWCLSATHHVAQAIKSPLIPIPVAGPFDQVGVDGIKFPTSSSGNQYAVVFVDYLTKWGQKLLPPCKDPRTIAHLLVEQLIAWPCMEY